MDMDYTARTPSPSAWRIQAWYQAGDACPFASSTVTVVLHGTDYWLLSEAFIVQGLAVLFGWLFGNNEVIQGSILLDAHVTGEAPSRECG
jgi:hypothetical protein